MSSREEKRLNADSDPTLARIVRTIITAINPKRIYLFGSHADGTQTDESDYDLLVIYDGPLDKRKAKLEILDQFDHFDFAMDLFVLQTDEFLSMKDIATTLAREVAETGRIVYG